MHGTRRCGWLMTVQEKRKAEKIYKFCCWRTRWRAEIGGGRPWWRAQCSGGPPPRHTLAVWCCTCPCSAAPPPCPSPPHHHHNKHSPSREFPHPCLMLSAPSSIHSPSIPCLFPLRDCSGFSSLWENAVWRVSVCFGAYRRTVGLVWSFWTYSSLFLVGIGCRLGEVDSSVGKTPGLEPWLCWRVLFWGSQGSSCSICVFAQCVVLGTREEGRQFSPC